MFKVATSFLVLAGCMAWAQGVDDSRPATSNVPGSAYPRIHPDLPGFHYYFLLVDGFQCNDPGSETYFGWNTETSGVEVPDKVDFYEPKNVPHGEVRTRWYFSKTTEQWRRAQVYTPPDYDTSGRKRYPVLYLQHGSGENDTSWVKQGRVSFIMDNLI